MNIVIFGCDNTGKTTLGESLASKLDYTYVHSLGPAVSQDDMCNFMESFTETGNVIFDRFPIIEEEVYGNLLRGKNRFGNIDTDKYCRKMLDKIDLFIYCYPGLFTTLNWGERDQMDGVKERSLDIISHYNKLAVKLKTLGYNVKEYNFKCDEVDTLVSDLKEVHE